MHIKIHEVMARNPSRYCHGCYSPADFAMWKMILFGLWKPWKTMGFQHSGALYPMALQRGEHLIRVAQRMAWRMLQVCLKQHLFGAMLKPSNDIPSHRFTNFIADNYHPTRVCDFPSPRLSRRDSGSSSATLALCQLKTPNRHGRPDPFERNWGG